MNAADYAVAKASGRCVGSKNCPNPRRPSSVRCEECQRRVTKAKYDRVQRKLAAGLCAHGACRNKTDGYRCEEHRKRSKAAKDAWKAKHPGRSEGWSKEYRRKRDLKGLCYGCNSPAVVKGHCERHRQRYLKASEAWRRRRGEKPCTHKCSKCGQPGHRYLTCKAVVTGDLRPMSLDELHQRKNLRDIEAHWGVS